MSAAATSTPDRREAILSLAGIAPVLGMQAAFTEVEEYLLQAGQARGLPVSQGLQAMALLHHRGWLPRELREAYLSLSRMLNDARQAQQDRVVPEPQVIRKYIVTAFQLADAIETLVGNGTPLREPAPTS